MVLNPGKYYCMTFGSNTTKNEFVLEDDTTIPSAEEHVSLRSIRNNNQFSLEFLFPFQVIIQKGCKQTKYFGKNLSIS